MIVYHNSFEHQYLDFMIYFDSLALINKIRKILSKGLLIAIDCVLNHAFNPLHHFHQGLGLVSWYFMAFLMSYKHLFLIGRLDNMALGANSDIVIFAKIFTHETDS